LASQVSPTSITIPAGASVPVVVTLKITKFADRKKAETVGQKGDNLFTSSTERSAVLVSYQSRTIRLASLHVIGRVKVSASFEECPQAAQPTL
jgi:hypothetical protein